MEQVRGTGSESWPSQLRLSLDELEVALSVQGWTGGPGLSCLSDIRAGGWEAEALCSSITCPTQGTVLWLGDAEKEDRA